MADDRSQPACKLCCSPHTARRRAQQGLAAGRQGGRQHAVAVVEVASLRREPLPAMRPVAKPASSASRAVGRAPAASADQQWQSAYFQLGAV